MDEIAERLQAVRARIDRAAEAAGRDPSEVRLLCVSKKQPDEAVRAAYRAGQRDFGENYPQALAARRAALPADIVWHMIGHVQSNKVAKCEGATWVHTLDSRKLAGRFARLPDAPSMRFLVQVRLSDAPGRSGVPAAEAGELVEASRAMGLSVVGLMGVPPVDEPPAPHFQGLAALAEELGLSELSMGMSGDFEAAVAAGATWVRVGTAILGARTA